MQASVRGFKPGAEAASQNAVAGGHGGR